MKHKYLLDTTPDERCGTRAGYIADFRERFWSKVDRTGECWVWQAYTRRDGYGVAVNKGRHMYAHRAAWELEVGQIPEGMFIDHKCHNRTCVRPAHLRLATPKQNAENHGVLRRDNKSGVRGVSWDKTRNRRQVHVGHHGSVVHVGRYASFDEAKAAVLAKRKELYTHNVEESE